MLDRDGKSWHAVYTRARHEKQVNRRLVHRGIETFLPLVDVLSRWKDRRKLVQKPLFPGYLFTCVDHERIVDVARTPGVVNLVGPEFDRPVVIPADLINNLQRLLASRVPVDPYPYLKKGQPVVIRCGPLKGVEGIVVSRKGIHKLVVSVHLLGRSVAATIAAEDVREL